MVGNILCFRRCCSLTLPEKELSLLNQSTVKLLHPTKDRVLASFSVMLRTAKAHSRLVLPRLSLCLLVVSSRDSYKLLSRLLSFSEPITVLWTWREPSSSHHHPDCWRQEVSENKHWDWPDWIVGQGLQGWKSCPTQKISTHPNRKQRACKGCCCWEPWRDGLQLWKERWVTLHY